MALLHLMTLRRTEFTYNLLIGKYSYFQLNPIQSRLEACQIEFEMTSLITLMAVVDLEAIQRVCTNPRMALLHLMTLCRTEFTSILG